MQRSWRWAAVLCLLLLAPVCAEYLAAYDESTGDPAALLVGLIFFVPLYGCPALLIREIARRTGMTWIGMVSLATGLGIVEAGLIDQSMFRTSYRGLDGWAALATPTYVEPLGFSVNLALLFVVGHVITTFCAPIAIAEALVPTSRHSPWLGRVGLAITALLYLAAAGLVLADHLASESESISIVEGALTSMVLVALVVLAFTVGRTRPDVVSRSCPSAFALFVAVAVAGLAREHLPGTWAGVTVHVALLAGIVLGLLWLSRSPRWTSAHVLAVAAGFVAAVAITGLVNEPLFGEVSARQKYLHSIVLSAMIGVLIATGARRNAAATTASS